MFFQTDCNNSSVSHMLVMNFRLPFQTGSKHTWKYQATIYFTFKISKYARNYQEKKKKQQNRIENNIEFV